MADLSHWIAQACEYHDSEGTLKVIYFQDRQELITVGEELQRDELLRSNMGSNVGIDQVTMPIPDWQPFWPNPAPAPAPAPAPNVVPAPAPDAVSVPAGRNRFWNKELFHDLPGCSPSSAGHNDFKELFDILPGCSTPSAVPKVQEANKKEESFKSPKSIEQPSVFKKIWRTLTRDRRVQPLEDYKMQNQDQGSSSLPRDINVNDLNVDPFKDARTPGYYKYALLFGIPTVFNPGGVWVIEELYNDMQESDF